LSGTYTVAPAAFDDIDDIAAGMRRQSPGADVDRRFIDAVQWTRDIAAVLGKSGSEAVPLLA
jgi:hypothetical protein